MPNLELLISYSTIEIIKGQLLIDKDEWHQIKLTETESQMLVQEISLLSKQDYFVITSKTITEIKINNKICRCVIFELEQLGNPDRTVQTYFNVDRYRVHNSKSGKARTAYPDGKFRVSQKNALVKLLNQAGIDTPKLTEVHKKLSKLFGVIVNGKFLNKDAPDRMRAETIRPVNISDSEVKELYETSLSDYSEIPKRFDRDLAEISQGFDGDLNGDFDYQQTDMKQDLRLVSSTGNLPQKHSHHSNADTQQTVSTNEPSIDDWLSDYNSAKS